jgi:hypothetical protein
VVCPEEIKQIINSAPQYSEKLNTFRLISYEDQEAHKHLLFAFELSEGQTMGQQDGVALLKFIVERLQELNLDFKSAFRTAPFKPELQLYDAGSGIFNPAHQKLKNDYVWNIDFERAKAEGIIK